MHTSFYHSWRGDTPDDAGFGLDMRVIRETLHNLEEIEREDDPIKVYWDFTVHWTIEKWLRTYGQDILNDIKHRVNQGKDEIVIGPYNNGFNSAAPANEFRKGIELSIENENESGLRQVFGKVAPIYRPQESVYTYGQNEIMKDIGIEGLIIQYATIPFNSFSNFVEPLNFDQRFNLIQLKAHEDDVPITVIPSITPADIVNYTSFEALLTRLRRKQLRGEIEGDVLVNINFDADAESWNSFVPDSLISIIPNSGGLKEYAKVVYKFDWAKFTTPYEYLKTHEPKSEVIIGQDLADGAFDGMSSWAEKFSSSLLWTRIQKSRVIDQQIEKYTGEDQEFDFDRFLALSTTHFGMMTPVLNQERRFVAWQFAENAIDHSTARLRTQMNSEETVLADRVCFQRHDVFKTDKSRVYFKIPVAKGKSYTPEDPETAFYEISRIPLDETQDLVEVLLFISTEGTESFCLIETESIERTYRMIQNSETIVDGELSITLNDDGVDEIKYKGKTYGTDEFLSTYIKYRRLRRIRSIKDTRVEIISSPKNSSNIIRVTHDLHIPKRRRLVNEGKLVYFLIPFENKVFTHLKVKLPRTVENDTLNLGPQTSFLRKVDIRWQEVAPFQITPAFRGNSDTPMRVWKSNFMEKENSYQLNYFRWSRNRNLDSFNNHLTHSWVAVTNEDQGLLISNDNSLWSNFAYAPMRLKSRGGNQKIQINPFGTYWGRQLNYDGHLDVSGFGSQVLTLFSAHVGNNSPTYNGAEFEVSLLMAPYEGNKPSRELINISKNLSYPPLIVFNEMPIPGIQNQYDLEKYVNEKLQEKAINSTQGDLARPENFSLLPAVEDLKVYWSLAWNDPRVSHFQLDYREVGSTEWISNIVRSDIIQHAQIDDLNIGTLYEIRMRSINNYEETPLYSEWSSTEQVLQSEHMGGSPISLRLLKFPQVIIRYILNTFSHNIQTNILRRNNR